MSNPKSMQQARDEAWTTFIDNIPDTLSPMDYVNARAPRQSGSSLHALVLRHTVQVARVLGGNITEDKLPTDFPTNDVRMLVFFSNH
ncbi:hypothetical protein QQS21_000670 [Conoideocrella luteorostrata]|uniref:Uncharacterized protein n=1 Tax=Conoideocrella luteorostrata TaxID=1105319 RepID=A0AAJ0CYQ5_9HYPO|nr:hypothetical protein QQS21_000670 [Conoideocrella luteorostrata]